MNLNYDVILFDLGGVLVELGEHPFPPEWLNGNASFKLEEWFNSRIAIAFEKGEISAKQFADSLIQELALNVNTSEFLAEFTAWPKRLFPGVTDLLDGLKDNHKLAVLSNCNELHWPRMLDEFQLENYFDVMFSSHIINKTKPENEAFEYVLKHLDTHASKVLFFDDNAINIEKADKLGIDSILVKGFGEVETFIFESGLANTKRSSN